MEDNKISIKNIKHYIQLYGLYAKMDAAWLLRDTKYALCGIFADSISNIAAVGSIFLLAWRFDGVGDMNKFEVLFMLGYITVITGVFQTFWSSNNTGHISRRIGRGQIEHMLMQPLPVSVQIMSEGFIPFTGSSNIITGISVITVSLSNLDVKVTWWWILSLFFNIAVTITIIIAQSYLFSSAAFYAPVAAEEISSEIINLGSNLSQYPLSGMPKQMQIPLITLFPSGLLGWFPSLALLGKPPLGLPSFFPLAVAAILFILAQYTFRKGFKYYAKTGTNRYLPYGHRR